MLSNPKTPGLRIWKNPGNGFSCAQLHYTADPKKRSDEWKKRASYGMEAKAWNCEMELSWENFAGAPVYGVEFNRELHITKESLRPDPRQPTLIRGLDFGGNHACVVVQYINGTLYVLKEYANLGYNTRRIVPEIVQDCNLTFGPGFRYIEVIDPSGLHEGKTSTGVACADVMRDLSLEIVPGIQDVTRRIDSVMQFLIGLNRGKPAFQIDPSCRMLIDGFLGGYAYPEKETQNQKINRPVKNEYSHIHDALQYACTRIESCGNYEVSIGDYGINAGHSGYRIG